MSQEQQNNELSPENYGDPNVDIFKEMDKFFDQQAAAEQTPPVAPETPPATPVEPAKTQQPEPPAKAPETPAKAPETPSGDTEPKVPVMKEEFFSEATETEVPEAKPSGTFDETAFDNETAAILKKIEEKGHPGDVYKELRGKLKEALQTTVSPEIKQKLETLEIKEQEIQGLKSRMSEMSAKSAKLMLEEDPIYQEEVLAPVADLFKQADELSASLEVDPNILRTIIRERDLSKQAKLMDEHFGNRPLIVQAKAADMATKFTNLVMKSEKMMSKAEETIERNKAMLAAQQQELLEKQRMAVQTRQKELWNTYKDIVPGLTSNGQDTSELKKLMSRSMAIDFGKGKASDQAFGAFAGTLLPYVMQQLVDAQAELRSIKKTGEQEVRQGANPSESVTTTPAAPKKTPDFMEAMAKDYVFTS